MARYLLTILFSLFYFLSIGQQRWENVIGTPDKDDFPSGVSHTIDGGTIVYGNDEDYMFLYKTDRNGEILWTKKYSCPVYGFSPSTLEENQDGKKVIVGSMGGDGWIMMLDECGDKLWCRTYDNMGNFWMVNFTDALIEDTIILVTAFIQDFNGNWFGYLLGFDYSGNLYWDKPVASYELDPLIADPAIVYLQKVGNSYFISGSCIYASQGHPNEFHGRYLFIKIDSLYNEEWLLAYGNQSYIGGDACGVIQIDSNKYRGYAAYCLGGHSYNSIFLDFDQNGNETRYKTIADSVISPNITFNKLVSLYVINDSTYYITAQMDTSDNYHNIGEFIVDSSGNIVYNYRVHAGAILDRGFNPSTLTTDGYFVSEAFIQNDTRDILLYKLDSNLSQVDLDSNSYVYDSLCNSVITSDTVYLNECEVVTSVSTKTSSKFSNQNGNLLQLIAYPNPVHGDIININIEEQQLYKNMQFSLFSMMGEKLMNDVKVGQQRFEIDVSNLPSGIYLVIVSNKTSVLGRVLFTID